MPSEHEAPIRNAMSSLEASVNCRRTRSTSGWVTPGYSRLLEDGASPCGRGSGPRSGMLADGNGVVSAFMCG